MERNLERKTLSFGKGMTNVPSDLLSDDTELAESDGFIYRDGEMKPVQEAKMVTGFGANGKLMYVHKSAGYKNLIGYNANNEIVCYIYDENEGIAFAEKKSQYFEIEGVTDVNSVGNTLLLATTTGIHYLPFKNGEYKDLGPKLPELKYNFYFKKPDGNYTQEETGRTLMNIDNCVEADGGQSYFDAQGKFLGAGGNNPPAHYKTGAYGYYKVKTGTDSKYENEFQETVQGHVAEAINWAKSKNMFAFPFFLRCAFRLFDGSYARITTPIICYPTINKNCRFSAGDFDKTHNTYKDLHQMLGTKNCFYFMEYKELYFNFSKISEDWRDIVKEIVVFASEQVITFYLDRGWYFVNPSYMHNKPYMNSGVEGYEEKLLNYDEKGFEDGTTIIPHDEIQPTYKSSKEIIDELLTKTQFYKLFSIGAYDKLVGGSEYHTTASGMLNEKVIGSGVLENLTTQEQLNVDDYYGWTEMTAERLFTYNNRIHLIGAKRYPFAGFNKFVGRMPSTNKDSGYTVYTHLVTSTSDTWVITSMLINNSFLRGWFYYPDPNATEVILYGGGKCVRIPLKAHPMLNGAYSFTNLPSKDGDATFEDITTDEIAKLLENHDQPEILNSQIFTSVVNNPFVFEASGDNMVGTGKILGIAANTEAVSQGQHGYAPLIVFTTEGMYALKTNSEGLYVGVDPLPREVCNNADSITPIDNYVIFTADKGLMAATGGSAVCLSEQMRGRAPRNFATMGGGRFLDFLKNCLIAYDYRDSILRIFKKSDGYTEDGDIVEDEKYYYIYDLVNKTFSMGKLDYPIKAVANDYPDNLIQDISGYVYSLTGKPDINDDEKKYSGSFTTRPLKLGGSMTLKSLRAIKHLYDTDEGKVKLEVYGSNDCKNWVKLTSLGGKPWKYFTFKYTLTDFRACDSFAGSIVEVQSRREDKMR